MTESLKEMIKTLGRKKNSILVIISAIVVPLFFITNIVYSNFEEGVVVTNINEDSAYVYKDGDSFVEIRFVNDTKTTIVAYEMKKIGDGEFKKSKREEKLVMDEEGNIPISFLTDDRFEQAYMYKKGNDLIIKSVGKNNKEITTVFKDFTKKRANEIREEFVLDY